VSKPQASTPIATTQSDDDSIPTRLSLLNRLKDWGDDTSWRDFFDTYWELIYNVARKAGLTDAESQEAVQETIIGVAKKIANFDTDPRRGSFKAWLMHQARWRIADQFAKRKFPSRTDSTPPGEDATGTELINRIPDPTSLELESVWDAEWQQHVTRTVLEKVKAQVSIKQFQMFDLHALQGLSAKEAARTLGVTMASVYMAKSRISRLMRREFNHFTER
jgi:RNA polymerase sigma factor (sigma-70 family)